MGTIGEQIDKLRKIEGLSIREFEDKVGASNGTIQKCINTGSSLNSKLVCAIAKAFPNVDLFALVSGEGEVKKNPITQLGETAVAYLSDQNKEIGEVENAINSLLDAMQQSLDKDQQQLTIDVKKEIEKLLVGYHTQKLEMTELIDHYTKLKLMIKEHFNI